MNVQILEGDCRETLKTLPENSVQCCVTSPPYWGLRDYGVSGQLGQEKTPDEYVKSMLTVFREVWRVLRDDGTLWLNLGDSYCNTDKWGGSSGGKHTRADDGTIPSAACRLKKSSLPGLKPKDLIGIPWRMAFALQADGWYLRSDIIWHKPNPMPESVTDRPTKSHEYIFLMSKSEKYFYDCAAIKEKSAKNGQVLHRYGTGAKDRQDVSNTNDRRTRIGLANWNKPCPPERNKRTVWTIPTASISEAHFATFPPDLIKPCIMAGSKNGDVVLDPFGGSGTTGMVALELGRSAVLCELNPDYIKLIEQRTNITPGMF